MWVFTFYHGKSPSEGTCLCVFQTLSQRCQHYLFDKMHTSLPEGFKRWGNPVYLHELPLRPLFVCWRCCHEREVDGLSVQYGMLWKRDFLKKKRTPCVFNCKIPSLSSDGMLLPLKPWSSKVERIPFTLRYLEHFGYSPVLWTVNIYSLRKPHNTWKSEIPKEICSNDWFSKRAW